MTAFIRTIVPVLWGSVIAWLLGKGVITPEIAVVLGGWETEVVLGSAALSTAAVYQAANWLLKQRWFPDWIARVFTGSVKRPMYLGD